MRLSFLALLLALGLAPVSLPVWAVSTCAETGCGADQPQEPTSTEEEDDDDDVLMRQSDDALGGQSGLYGVGGLYGGDSGLPDMDSMTPQPEPRGF